MNKAWFALVLIPAALPFIVHGYRVRRQRKFRKILRESIRPASTIKFDYEVDPGSFTDEEIKPYIYDKTTGSIDELR